jgi:choline dehydrogenase
MTEQKTCDYLVVGGGTAGCVLAARLSADPDVQVTLLEAGAAEGPDLMSDPKPGAAVGLWRSSVDWAYSTVPQPGTEDAVHFWPRGKVLGGSSSINGMMHDRTHSSSYDAWETLGATGWNYDALLPFLRRSEHTEGTDPRERGTDGPMRIEAGPQPSEFASAAYRAAEQTGHPACADGDASRNEGVSWAETNVVAGRRQSAADAYLRPVLGQANLTVLTEAHVRRLLFDGTRCVGAEYTANGATHTVLADREVVLSAGVIGSAQLLLLSGVGPAGQLSEVGVPMVHDLPGVGENLHDHPLSWVTYQATRSLGVGPDRQAHILTRSDPAVRPDLLMSVSPWAPKPRYTGAWPNGFSILVALVNPASRGSLRLRSADSADAPVIDPAYLSDPGDVDRLAVGLAKAREIATADALAGWRGEELLPGVDVRDDEALRAHVRRTAATYFHAVGTCRIGTDDLAVVDPTLRVRGVDGLRVADASVMPSVVSGPTNAAVLGIAERAADLLLTDAQR